MGDVLRAVFLAGCTLITIAQPSAAQTLAWWRFEPQAVRDSALVVPDSSGNENRMAAHAEGTSPALTEAAASDTVPQTGDPNRGALDNTAKPVNDAPTRDLFLARDKDARGVDLAAVDLQQWTIEASVKFKSIEGWEKAYQTFVGRDGYDIPQSPVMRENRLAGVGFKKRGDTNKLSIEAWDSSAKYVVVQAKEPVKPDVWYHAAAVCDGKTLRLYVREESEREFTLQGAAEFAGPMNARFGNWTIGRGMYLNYPAEQTFGFIDEVRISAAALRPELFLASPKSNLPSPQNELTTMTPPPSREPPKVAPGLVYAHDPATIRDGEYIHILASHEGFSHWRSKDLVTWEKLSGIFKEAPSWSTAEICPDPKKVGFWAPDVAFFNDKFHVYYSMSTWGSKRSGIGVISSPTLNPDDPRFKWTDHGKVIESFGKSDFNAIDPSIMLDANGAPWMAFGSYNKGIFLARIDAKTGMISQEDPKLHHLAARPQDDMIEGPHLFHREGWYYLSVSLDGCCRGAFSTYKLVIGRSREITGPYVDRDGKPMLEGNASLLLRTCEHQIGPGHSSIIEFNGAQILAHHYYDGRLNGRPTVAFRPLYWDADGWPLVGEPLAEQSSKRAATLAGEWLVHFDYAKTAKIKLNDDGSAQSESSRGTWRIDADKLELRWQGEVSDALDQCFIAADGNSFVGRRGDGTIVRGVRTR